MARRVTIDARSLGRLSLQMKAAERNVRSSYRKGLKEIGNDIRDDAAARIAPVSPTVAGELKVRTRMPATVIVEGGSKTEPIGALLEGHLGQQGAWRHPLFGNRAHWYSEMRHPHLYPAFKRGQPEAMKNLQDNVKDGIRAAGLKGPSA